MASERIKEIQETTAYPESLSVMLALKQVWNECAQESYSQDEVFMILENYRNWTGINFHQGEWFEQFKK